MIPEQIDNSPPSDPLVSIIDTRHHTINQDKHATSISFQRYIHFCIFRHMLCFAHIIHLAIVICLALQRQLKCSTINKPWVLLP